MEPVAIPNLIVQILAKLNPQVIHQYSSIVSRSVTDTEVSNCNNAHSILSSSDAHATSPDTAAQNNAISMFIAPGEPTGFTFPHMLRESFLELTGSELCSLVMSDLTKEQWHSLANWITTTVASLNLPFCTVIHSLLITDRYLWTADDGKNPDVLTAACASLFIAAKFVCEYEISLKTISAYARRPSDEIKEMESVILEILDWKIVNVTAHEYVAMLNEFVFSSLFSAQQINAKHLLESILLNFSNFNFDLSHLRPSCIAFSCVLTVLAVFDPVGQKQCNLMDLMSFVKVLKLPSEEIEVCTYAFVEYLNRIYYGFQ